MNDMKNTLISAGVAVLVVVLGFMFFAPEPNVITQVLGSASSPSVNGGCMNINGVTSCYSSTRLNQASTTICSLKAPSATSTLRASSGVSVTTGTTTALFVDLGRSTFYDATTTVINSTIVPSGALFAINATTTNTGTVVFAPNQYLNVKYGGAALGSLNVLVGSCSATWDLL